MNAEPEGARSVVLESAKAVPAEIREDWINYLSDIVIDGMWTRPTLSPRLRSLMTVAALATLRCPAELRTQIRVALLNGLTRLELCELMLQVTGYAGLGVGREGMAVLSEVFDEQLDPGSVGAAEAAQGGWTRKEARLERGCEMMKILNPGQVDQILEHVRPFGEDDPFTPDSGRWTSWITETAFGALWPRPNLTLQERERITLAVLTVLGHEREIEGHFRISLGLGIPPEEIGESIIHLALYIGYPTTVKAIMKAREVIESAKAEGSWP